MTAFARTTEVIDAGRETRAFPAAAIEVGCTREPLWRHATGRLTFAPDAPPADLETVFDLASLTKVIATTSLVMRAIDQDRLTLATSLRILLPAWAGDEMPAITVQHLLDHSSGLPAHARLWHDATGREGYLRALTALPLERPPGTAAVYSDPGFLLLGLALERSGVLDAPDLDSATTRLLAAVTTDLRFLPPAAWRARTAPTEIDAWRGRLLVGEVHDENAAAIGGVAAHAGLFGTVEGVGAFARLVLRSFHEGTVLGPPELMRRFATRTGVAGSSRALGWDTMLPTSSCGTRLSPQAIGHTGFTGTSLWIDPTRDLYVALLSNRVHPTRANDAFVALRPAIHDAVVADLEDRPRTPS